MFAPVEIAEDLTSFHFSWQEVHDKMGLKGEELPFEYMEKNLAEFGAARRIKVRPSEQGIGIEFRQDGDWVEKVTYNFDEKKWEGCDLEPRETIAIVGFLSAFRCHLAEGHIRPVLSRKGHDEWAFEWFLTEEEVDALLELQERALKGDDTEIKSFINKIKMVIYDATPIIFDFSLPTLSFFLNDKRVLYQSGSFNGWSSERLIGREVDILTIFICFLLTTAEKRMGIRR